MSTTSKAGRPREFDLEEALVAALGVFRTKGYEGASLSDLTDAMGINRPSLYAAFGDKHALYLRAIDHYAGNSGCAPLVAFDSEPDIAAAVRAFLTAAIDYAVDQPAGQKGCFLASCVATSAGEVEGAADRLQKAIKDTDARLAARFEKEKKRGSLPADFPSLARAKLLFDMRQGLVLRARAGLSARSMKSDLGHRVAAVLA